MSFDHMTIPCPICFESRMRPTYEIDVEKSRRRFKCPRCQLLQWAYDPAVKRDETDRRERQEA